MHSIEAELMAGEVEGGSHLGLLNTLVELRTELIDLAFALEHRPQLDAADLACILANRLEEIIAKVSPSLNAGASDSA